ncbi:hypothetical protein J8F10_19715 [Gemmata sp. G18]|uniref:Uncharacterized protein n=1 Tax=Gemmata palustris TaxID=2822762 RepID=A0ABS5BUU7_9BACT|nr:hypothetical protein [Gemmata palustris]MBP3957481.1 hypothetical protein [Gemmata palustris]
MKTNTYIGWRLVLPIAAAGSVMLSWAHPSAPAKPRMDVTPVSVASLEDQLPVGHLGVPLGTVVRVTGEALDGSTTGAKADAGKTLLRIVAVNGKELAKPVVFEFLRAPKDVKEPKAGEKIDYYVHEYGEFDGVVTPPKELGIEGPLMIANDGFHYRRHLTVHASNPVRK